MLLQCLLIIITLLGLLSLISTVFDIYY